MKLDTKVFRYLSAEDWRTLTAVEMGSKNHEVVPTTLINQIAGLRGSNTVHKSIAVLAKAGLIARVRNAKYDGYRLTYGGLDYLALNTHRKSDHLFSIGNQVGVGKESDIYACASSTGQQRILKIHRLGRISFRTVKANRDYLRNRSSGSWMYMSRLAALKEFTFMRALKENGFPVPEPVAQNRHTVVMSLINSFPLRQISSVPDPASLYAELMSLVVKLASFGLIHGDFNEFNILIEETPSGKSENGLDINPTNTNIHESDSHLQDPILSPIIIDFPQMVSISHPDAARYFDRDVDCIKTFFARRFKFTSDEKGPFFDDATKFISKRLDVEVEASGFSRKMAKELETYLDKIGTNGSDNENEDDYSSGSEGQRDAEEENEREVVTALKRDVGTTNETSNETFALNGNASELDERSESSHEKKEFQLTESNLASLSIEQNVQTFPSVKQAMKTKAASGWVI